MSDPASNETAPTTPALYPGQSAPLTVITATDQTGVVLIAAALALIFSAISMFIRAFIRLEFRHKISRDDIAAVLAMVISVVQSVLVFVAAGKGFGKTLSDVLPGDLADLQKELYGSDILYIITLWLTKCSVAFLFLRLSPDKNHALIANGIAAVSTIVMVVSVFMIAIKCNPSVPWIFIGEKCTGVWARWQAITAFDIITEAALFGTAFYMVHGLQLGTEKKAIVILAFALRVPVIVPGILRLHYLNVEFTSGDPTLDGVVAAVCTQVQISYAIIATTTPCLRPFMSALSTNYGGPAQTRSPSGTKATGTGNSGNGYSLSNLSNGSRARNGTLLSEKGSGKSRSAVRDSTGNEIGVATTTGPGVGNGEPQQYPNGSLHPNGSGGAPPANGDKSNPQTRWDQHEYNVAVKTGDQHSLGSHDSKQMIINKNTEWQVEYDDTADRRV